MERALRGFPVARAISGDFFLPGEPMRFALSCLFTLGLIFTTAPSAFASSAGDACTTSGAVERDGAQTLICNGTAWVLSVVHTTGGNTGIGTASPGAKLDVSGTAVIQQLTGTSTTSYLKMTNTGQGSANGFQVQTTSNDIYLTNYNTGNFYLYNNNAAAVAIAATSNNVGIGTTSPKTKLDVSGSFVAGGIGGCTSLANYQWGYYNPTSTTIELIWKDGSGNCAYKVLTYDGYH